MASPALPANPQDGDPGHSTAHAKIDALLNTHDYDKITAGATSGQMLRVDPTTKLLTPVTPTPDMVGADPVGAASTAQANAQAYTDEQVAGIAGIGTEFHAFEALAVPGYVPSSAATSGTVTVDVSVSKDWHISVDAATTILFAGMDPSQVSRIRLRLRYLGAYGVTFDPNATVVGVPALSSAAGKIDILTLASWPNTGASSGIWYYEGGVTGLTAPGVTAPATPVAPTLSTVSGGTSVTVSWSAPDNGGATITGYAWRVLNASTNAVLASGTTTTARTATATGLTAGTSVYAQVDATNSAGTSPWSPASITLTVGASNAARDPNTGFPSPLGVGCAVGGIWPPRSDLSENNYEDGYETEETYLGRTLEFARQYSTTVDKAHFGVGGGWDYSVIGAKRNLCVSYRGWITNADGSNTTYPWYTTDGTPSVATGCVDTDIKARGKEAGAYMVSSGRPLWVTFHHEPEAKTNAGSGADFCKAWCHFCNQFLQGARTATGWTAAVEARLYFGIITLASSYTGSLQYSGKAGETYFDSTAVDPMDSTFNMGDHCKVIACDGYNWYGTATNPTAKARSFEDIFCPSNGTTGWYGWATSGDRAGSSRVLAVTEFSSQDPASATDSFSKWMDDAAKALPKYPKIGAILVWSSDATGGNSFDVRETATKHAGWKAAVATNYPYLNPNLAPAAGGATAATLQSATSQAVFTGGATGKALVPIPATYSTGDLIVGVVYYGAKAATLTLPTGFTAIGSPVAVGASMMMQPIWKVATADESANAGDSSATNQYPFITKDSTGALTSVLFSCAMHVWHGAGTAAAPSVYTGTVSQGQSLALPSGIPSLNAADVLALFSGGQVNNFITKSTAAGTSSKSFPANNTFLGNMVGASVDIVTISATATPSATGITVSSWNATTSTATLSTAVSWANGDALVLSRPAGSANNAGEIGTPASWPSPAALVSGSEAANVTKYPTSSGFVSSASFTANAAGVPSWSGSVLPNGPLPGDYGVVAFRVVPA